MMRLLRALFRFIFSRDVLKSLSWRTFALSTTTIIVYLQTDSLAIAGSIAGVDSLFKLVEYWIHEKVWRRIWPETAPCVCKGKARGK